MGCDITLFVEVRRGDEWALSDLELDVGRSYGLFGFLADVRNYSEVPVIAEPRGIPEDVSRQVREEHDDWGSSASWLTLGELLNFDYEQVFWDRRITREVSPGSFDGAARAEEGEGRHLSVREFLGPWYFAVLERLRSLGAPDEVRIVFWFSY